MTTFTYPLSGLFVGLLVGLTGVGGGSLMTPILILLFGMHPTSAVGSDLLYASMTKVVGTAVHGRQRSVHWRIVGLLASGSIPAAAVTLLAIARYGGRGADPRFVSVALGLVLLLTAALLVYRSAFVRIIGSRFDGTSPAKIAWFTVFTGLLLGVAVTMTSVGAGAIGMTVLLVLYPRVEPARLVGSDIAHAVPLTLLAGAGHWLLGDVNLGLVGSLLIGSVPGVILGSVLSSRLPETVLRIALAALLLAASLPLLT